MQMPIHAICLIEVIFNPSKPVGNLTTESQRVNTAILFMGLQMAMPHSLPVMHNGIALTHNFPVSDQDGVSVPITS
jgi:hypothetical protein